MKKARRELKEHIEKFGADGIQVRAQQEHFARGFGDRMSEDLSILLADRTVYDTKAMSRKTWETLSDKFLKEGWEYNPQGSMVYLRKHRSGPLNEVSTGWIDGSK